MDKNEVDPLGYGALEDFMMAWFVLFVDYLTGGNHNWFAMNTKEKAKWRKLMENFDWGDYGQD